MSRSRDQAPRGTYYISVGDRFYAGVVVDKEVVEKTIIDKERPWAWNYWGWGNGTGESRGRLQAQIHKKKQGEYLKAPKAKKITVERFSGKREARLVDDLAQAKRFKKRDVALNTCEKLRTVYGSLDIAIDIHFEQGDTP